MPLQIVNYAHSVLNYLAPDTGLFDPSDVADRLKRTKALASPRDRLLCHSVDVNFMEIMPQLMIAAGPGLMKHVRVRERLAKRPLMAATLLLSNYDEMHPFLERIVLGNGEAIVPLLLAIDDGLVNPSRAREHIESALLDHPWWALRYLYSQPKEPHVRRQRASFANALLNRCKAQKASDAQSALVFLAMEPNANPSDYIEVLCSNPMTAYIASHLFAIRDFDVRVSQVQNLDARWATHIALWGAFSGGNLDERIEDAICTDSAWTGEYIARNETRQNDWNWVKSLFDKSEQNVRNRQPGEADIWADMLWALLDRICLRVEGKPAKITLKQSYLRHGQSAPNSNPSSVSAQN